MTPTKPNFTPNRPKEFRLYIIWKSLARDISAELFEGLGVTDQTILELAEIKTQKQFAATYKLEQSTLTEWNKHIHAGNIPDEYKELDWRYWARQATPSVASAMLRELRKHGDAPRFSAWMKYVEQIEDKSVVSIDSTERLFEGIRQIAERHASNPE